MTFDWDAPPEHQDLVLLWRDGGRPFVRCCEIAPIDLPNRSDWHMGVLDTGDGSVVMFDIGKCERVGVCTGVIDVEVGMKSSPMSFT